MVVTGKSPTTHKSAASEQQAKGPTGLLASKLPILKDGDKKALIEESKNAFCKRRRVQISGIPPGTKNEELSLMLLKGFNVVDIFRSDVCTAHVLLATPDEASRTLAFLKEKYFKNSPVQASFSQSESLFFVGNIPYFYTAMQFRNMVKIVGDIERIILVRSEKTGQSKGYGFVEFTQKSATDKALEMITKTYKNLRVDRANTCINEYYDLQSQTLYVTQFPPGTSSEQIEELVDKHCQVPFCKIPLDESNGKQCSYALIDCKTPEDAEMLWKKLDGADVNGGKMRLSFNPPGRLAATLLGGQSSKPLVSTMSTAAVNKLQKQASIGSKDGQRSNTESGPEAMQNASHPSVKKSTTTEPQLAEGLLPNPPGPRPQNRQIHPQGFPPRFPAGHPRFRPPRNLLDMDPVDNYQGPPPDDPHGRGLPRMFDPRGGPRGPPRPGPPRGFMGPRNSGPPQPLMNLRGPPEPFDARGPRPIGGFRGEMRPERPRFPVDGPPPNAPFPARGPRPREPFARLERPPMHPDAQLRGRNPDFRFQRPPGPRVPGPGQPVPPDVRDRKEAGNIDQEAEKHDDPSRKPQRRPHSEQKPGPSKERSTSNDRHFPQERRRSPDHRRSPDRRRSPERRFVDERPVWPERPAPGQDYRREGARGENPDPLGNRREGRPPWDADRGRERDLERERFERGRRETDPSRPEIRQQDSRDFHHNPPPAFHDRGGSSEQQRQPWDDFERRPPAFPDRRNLPPSDDFRDGPPSQGPEEPWMRRRSPPRGMPPHEQRDVHEPRPQFQDRPPWNEPDRDKRRFNEPYPDARSEQRETRVNRRPDELRHDFNQGRGNLAMDRPYPDDTDSFRPDEWRQANRHPNDDRARPSRDPPLDLQHVPPFDSRHPSEDRLAASFPSDRGHPDQSHGRYPQDREHMPAVNQPRDGHAPTQGDFQRPAYEMPAPGFDQPGSFHQQFGGEPQGFPQPFFQQQRPQQHLPTSQNDGFQPQQPFPGGPGSGGPHQQPVQGLPQFPSTAAQPQSQPPPAVPTAQAAAGLGQMQQMQNRPPQFPPQNQQPFLPSSAPVGQSASTNASASVAVSIPSIPGMPAFQMPSVQAGALMPMGAGPLNTQQGVPDVGPQQPPMAPGQPNAPSQQSSSQLDAYVAAASAAQQYAQYYEQLAKQHEVISQQSSAPGSKESATVASQAKAYAQYYQQYYQHMQSILQLAKSKSASQGQAQQQQQQQQQPQMPAAPSVNQAQTAVYGQLPMQINPGIQFQQASLPSRAPAQVPVGVAMPQNNIPMQNQQLGVTQMQQLQQDSQYQGQVHPVSTQQPAWQMQQHPHLAPPQRPVVSQMVTQQQPNLGAMSSQPPTQQHQQQPQGQVAPLPGQYQHVGLQQQQQQLHLRQETLPQQQHPSGSYGLQQPMQSQPTGIQDLGGQQARGQQPGVQQIRSQDGGMPVQPSSAASGMNWMYSAAVTTTSVRPQHIARPVLYSSPGAQPRDQAGDKRQPETKTSVYGPHKRPRY